MVSRNSKGLYKGCIGCRVQRLGVRGGFERAGI